MPTNPMLSAGHMAIVDALKYGQLRDYPTVIAALNAIGAENRILLIPNEGDGIWTINSPVTIPPNVVLWMAPGAKWAGTGHMTMNGQLIAFDDTWFTGSGGQTLNFENTNMGGLQVARLGVNTPPLSTVMTVFGTPSIPAVVQLLESVSGTGASIDFISGGLEKGNFGLIGGAGGANIQLIMGNNAHFIVSGGNVGLGGITPTAQLELGLDSAKKPTTNTWTITSDARLKQVVRDYEDGLALIQAVHPVWFTYNGLGGMVQDGQEHVGLLAQELQPHAPYMVDTSPGKLHEQDPDTTELLVYQGHAMTFALINAVKQLAARVEALEAALPGGTRAASA